MYKTIEELVTRVDERNNDGIVSELIGVSIDKCFIKSVANTNGTDLSKYKIIRKNDFAVSLMQVSRDGKIPVARLEEYEEAIMSPAYPIFRVKDNNIILPEYLEMWFKRPEFDREAAFIAVGGVRGSMPWEEFAKMKLPVPPIEKQRKIVNAYKIVTDRIALKQKINDNLEAQAEAIYNEMIANNSTNSTMSTLGEISTIKTGKLNSEAAVTNGIYPFFTCSQETYRTNTFSFDQEAVLLAGNNASAIYPLKIYCGKFDVYQRTYVISSNNRFVSNKQLYFVLKQQLNEFKGISSGTTTKFLTMKILTPIPVVIAPEDISTSFINITNKMFETIFQNQREIEHLHELQMIVLGELSRN
ncbi:restriction endonuclease subunit S [Lachnospira eligens]|uniref:restriction endonuclease subunit S n=1 Tax=Lachnospira eligens TaxID=39485 RepID=UPI0016512BA2|nr:restriction endonuclease subunit S [Lachnospira eligens]